jgi:FKBP-type peptidyl-prolyl cis-trans isomerase FkpA
MRSISTYFAVAVCCALAGACNDSPTVPSNFAPFSQTDLRVGTGGDAVTGRTLTVQYTGWYFNDSRPDDKGPIFDTSAGGDPFVFILGTGGVIEGWDRGLTGMRVGGLRRLVIPPSLAYGRFRQNSIPPNATLLFEVELLEVADPAAAQ